MPEWDRQRHQEKISELPDFGATPFVAGPPLRQRRVAIISTAGLHVRGDRPFEPSAADYRIIPV